MNEGTLTTLIAQVKHDTDNYLLSLIEHLPSHAPQLKEAMQYALLVGGKRMRPVLHAIVANMLNVSASDSLKIGAAIECIHAYSLIHDDLPAMDDDDLRRGQPTCHIKFDEATAILAGDALQTLAFEILTTADFSDELRPKMIAIIGCIAKASGYLGMCGGQAIDLASTDSRISIEKLTQLHQLKTGALLVACVDTATLAGADVLDDSRVRLLTYARSIGLAFQVQDDILDVTESSETLGKPAGSDERSNKSTFPALMGLADAQQQLKEYHATALQALDGLSYNTQLLRQFADLMLNRTH